MLLLIRIKLLNLLVKDSFDHFKSFKQNNSPVLLLSLYHHCDPIIQSGPTCGLVALIMCLKLIDNQYDIDLSKILIKAKSYGITRFGEMFSVENMAKFIREEFSLNAEHRYDLERSMYDVIEHLCNGQPILVPYDSDFNHEPGLRQGNRAHWALLCGFCLVDSSSETVNILTKYVEKTVNLETDVLLCPLKSKKFDNIKHLLSMDRLFVYARQGKSKHLHIWNYRKLCESNQNLRRIKSKILNNNRHKQMIYPLDGRLDQSLCNQFIFIYG
ncbi:hypothetical protein DERF_014148 [Dermatophagoides farinae]|uniref:Actin maturation protease n=1 Tax=Dermatophagoides farinae TaxID=6954 RepID=A0A922HL60_DERFA|nr:hypothetical protein DERF_014148 [Dermatophagoides farinae]